jgi:hypothetical protein
VVELGRKTAKDAAAPATSTVVAAIEDKEEREEPKQRSGKRRSKKPRESSAVKADNWELKSLKRLLEKKGLTMSDLDHHPGTSGLHSKHVSALRRRNDADISRTAKDLSDAVENLPLDRTILQRRLDRLLMGIRGASRAVPENLLTPIENDYFKCQADLSKVKTPETFLWVSKRIAVAERDLRQATRGE